MKMKPITLAFVLLVSVLSLARTSIADTNSGVEQALRDLDAQWAKAAAAKDVDKTISYYSSDAIVLPPNEAAVSTPDGIRKAWQGMFAMAGMSITWKPTRVEVSKSGDMACVTGTYEFTMSDASGKAQNDHGKYLEVWEKRADGSWKCGADMWSSDLPVPGSK